jgi:hypothetical protein
LAAWVHQPTVQLQWYGLLPQQVRG